MAESMTKAELEKALAGKEAELARVRAEKEAEPAPDPENDPRRLVRIKLFKDSGRYSEPLYVRVGDYSALIKRGVEVRAPYYVAKHIEEMEKQDAATAGMVSALAESFDAEARRRGV